MVEIETSMGESDDSGNEQRFKVPHCLVATIMSSTAPESKNAPLLTPDSPTVRGSGGDGLDTCGSWLTVLLQGESGLTFDLAVVEKQELFWPTVPH